MLVRILTAICLIFLVLWALFGLDTLNFAIASGALFVLGGLEWTNLCQYRHWAAKCLFTLLLLGSCVLLGSCALLGSCSDLSWLNPKISLFFGSIFWLLPLFWVLTYRQVAPFMLKKRPILAIIGLLMLSLAWLAINQIRLLEGPQFVIILFILVWSCDTFAYFVGRFFGKTPLAPMVSPKKTWAGFWGGLIGALLSGLVCFIFIEIPTSRLPLWLGMALITILLAILGDLFESLVKRISGVKDSGKLLPGHGGVLDRIDSLLAALPFYAFALMWMRGN